MPDPANAPYPVIATLARARSRPQLDPNMVLINEAHHRIKNNLQLIAAMLYMQARRNSSVPDVYATLMQAGHRVRAVAQLHERLQHGVGGNVDAGEYLHDLCANLSRSLGLSTSRAVVVKSPLVLLQADCMLRLGMIVTELVTNAAKHGITPLGTCHIRVVLTPTHQDTFRLLVSDTGPGIPDIASCGTHGSLGLVLVRHLTDAIGGRIEIDGTPPGARFIIRFPQGGKARRKGDAEESSGPWA